MPSMPPSPIKPSYQLYCGVDIAAKTFTAATCKADEEPTKASNFKQSPQDYAQLQKHLLSSGVTPSNILIVMEATGTYWIELATYLDNCGFAVSVINPSRMHKYAKSLLLKSKNDLLDAQTLSRLALAQKPARWVHLLPSIESCPKG
jgi:transposase